jgi:O-glycosyl hydrolase
MPLKSYTTKIFHVFILTFFILSSQKSFGQPVLIDPNMKYQEFEGWGGSLCWWANIMGGYSDVNVKKVCDWITDPQGTNMNIFRFNIGGGDDPAHNHMRGDGGAMPGYKASAEAPYDWTQDENQRRIVLQLIESRIAQTGQNDIILEAFANSPPYWMTKSGCSAGNFQGGVSNLKDDMYDDFADYLTEVTKYYHDSLGVTFHTIDPFNEPFSTWWIALGGQEGCYFGQSDQEKMIRELYSKLQEKDMLKHTGISAMDANSLDETYNGVVGYKKAGDILPKLSNITTHSYFGSANSRKNLARWCLENDFTIWQSESGPLNISGTDQELLLIMAARIVKDIKELNAVAWIDWQLAADQSQVWGLLVGEYYNPLNPVSKGDGYFYRAQFSRFIKPGYTIIDAKNPSVLAALSPDEKQVVIVTVNEKSSAKAFSFDLGAFALIDGPIERFRTREVNPSYTERLARITNVPLENNLLNYDAPAYSVTTFVIPVKIAPEQIEEGAYYLINKATGLYAGITNASLYPGGRLALTGTEPTSNASFYLSPDVITGGARMKPGHVSETSKFVLDVEGASNADGVRIIQYNDANVENQRFHFVHHHDNYFYIKPRNSMKCLSVAEGSMSGANVLQNTCTDADNFLWQMVSLTSSVETNLIDSPQLVVSFVHNRLNVYPNQKKMIKDIRVISVRGDVIYSRDGLDLMEYSMNLTVDQGYYIVSVTYHDGTMMSERFVAI